MISRPTIAVISFSLSISDTGHVPIYWASRSTVTLSARVYMSSKRCDMKIMDVPFSFSCLVILYNSSLSFLVRAAVGSSIMIIFASVERALAISTICCWATLRAPICVLALMPAPSSSRSSCACSCISFHSTRRVYFSTFI